jgi:hypothetical protein
MFCKFRYAKLSVRFLRYSFLKNCKILEIFYLQISDQNVRIILKQVDTLSYCCNFVDLCSYGLVNITPGLEEYNFTYSSCMGQRSSGCDNL